MLQFGKNIIHKIIAVLFFMATATPFVFSSLLLIKQQCARYKMKERLESEILHTLALPENEVVWVKKNKEIRIGKDLFDVKCITKESNKLLVTGLFDHEETDIEQRMAQLPDENGTRLILIKLLSLFQNIFSCGKGFELQNALYTSGKITSEYSPALLQFPHEVLTPPPL